MISFFDVSKKISIGQPRHALISSVSSSTHSDTRTTLRADANPSFPARYSADVKCEMDTPHQPRYGRHSCCRRYLVNWHDTKDTTDLHAPARCDTRINLQSRNTGRCHTRIYGIESRGGRTRRQVNTCVTVVKGYMPGMHLARSRAAGTSLRTLPASRQNYDPVRFALSAGRDCITMRGIPGIAFTCLELLRGPQ